MRGVETVYRRGEVSTLREVVLMTSRFGCGLCGICSTGLLQRVMNLVELAVQRSQELTIEIGQWTIWSLRL